MKLAIITPVGPGHERIADRAMISVSEATSYSWGPFTEIRRQVVPDPEGVIGRSAARNAGMKLHRDADWFFFLDADDEMTPEALTLCDQTVDATFGAVALSGKVVPENVWPCTWFMIGRRCGARGTLSMGFFCRASVALDLLFNEEMDAGEDFDFYMRLPTFTKVKPPLVNIGRDVPSAGGPRGYEALDWIAVCNQIIDDAVKRAPSKFEPRTSA